MSDTYNGQSYEQFCYNEDREYYASVSDGDYDRTIKLTRRVATVRCPICHRYACRCAAGPMPEEKK